MTYQEMEETLLEMIKEYEKTAADLDEEINRLKETEQSVIKQAQESRQLNTSNMRFFSPTSVNHVITTEELENRTSTVRQQIEDTKNEKKKIQKRSDLLRQLLQERSDNAVILTEAETDYLKQQILSDPRNAVCILDKHR